MGKNYIYITDEEWFENSANKNPISVLDHNLEHIYPHFYCVNYDLKILVTKPASLEERQFPGYNDYRERYGFSDDSKVCHRILQDEHKYVFLNGFDQKQFENFAPLLKDSTEVLYLFKCPKIKDLSALSSFNNLKCIHIYWNNSLERLWDMQNNTKLQVLSFLYVTKIKYIGDVVDSQIEYINFDSSDNSGKKKKLYIDKSVFDQMKSLKYLFCS